MENENAQAIDLSCYRWDGSWEWMKEAQATESDSKRVMAQFYWLCDKMRQMKVGEKLSVLKICSNPAYYGIAVRMMCINILAWKSTYRAEKRDYEFNDTYTELRRVI